MPTRADNLAWIQNLLLTSDAVSLKTIILTLAMLNLNSKSDDDVANARATLTSALGLPAGS